MPLNKVQLQTLEEILRPNVEEIIDSGNHVALTGVISKVALSKAEVVTILKNKPALVEGILNATNTPEPMKDKWRAIQNSLRDSQSIDDVILTSLIPSSPNYNPFYITHMEIYKTTVMTQYPTIHTTLIRLRELFLGMTPEHEYSYGERYITFHFRIGVVPLSLDKLGGKVTTDEIRSVVERFINDRIEIHEKYLTEINKLKAENERNMREVERLVGIMKTQQVTLQLMSTQYVASNQNCIRKEEEVANLKRKITVLENDNKRLRREETSPNVIDKNNLPSFLERFSKSDLLKVFSASHLPFFSFENKNRDNDLLRQALEESGKFFKI